MRPIDAVREAHDALRKTARAHRRAFAASPLSAFVTAMRAAMDEYRTFRREGVSRDDACRGLEAVLRDAWPHQASKFDDACPDCADTGWRERFCDQNLRCGRRRCALHPEVEHAYVTSCSCPAGARLRQRPRVESDAVVAAGRVQKPRKGFFRVGQ
jgi:hypothetical protein